jgi:hypothetical protein
MAQSYSFFQGIPAEIPETDCLEIVFVDEDNDSIIEENASNGIYDDDSFCTTTKEPYCKCGKAKCVVNSMPQIQHLRIMRDLDFSRYFPDLFLNDVPKHYSLPDVYSSINHLGDGIVSNITIVPGGQYNQFVVKFDSFHIPQHTYDRTICMRWEFYLDSLSREPGRSCKWLEFKNVSVFNETKWRSQERFGVEHYYSRDKSYSLFQGDPRCVQLHKYLKDTHYSCGLTDDAVDFLIEENNRMENEFEKKAFEMHDFITANSWAPDASYELEDGEVHESHLYIENDKHLDLSAYDNYSNNYIYKFAEEDPAAAAEDYSNLPVQTIADFDTLDNTSNICIAEDGIIIENEDLYSMDDNTNPHEHQDEHEEEDDDDYPQKESDSEDDTQYEYCEISKGVWHRRPREDYEDPDELHYRINNATNPRDRAKEFWN